MVPRLSLLVGLVVAAGLAGCVGDDGGDTAPVADDGRADAATAAEGVGSLTGQILDAALEPVRAAYILLSGGAAFDTRTDVEGRYTINAVPPGAYVLRIDALGYHNVTRNVRVPGGVVTELSIQLEPLSDIDLGLPFIDEGEFHGFIACGIGQAILPQGSPGYAPGINPRFSLCGDLDANDAFQFHFNLRPGLDEIVVGVTWQPVGGVSGRELNLNFETDPCGLTCPDESTYADVAGPPDLIVQLRDEHVHPDLSFANLSAAVPVQLRVFPAATQTPNLIYQQPFDIYYELYYNQFAPPERDPIPDG